MKRAKGKNELLKHRAGERLTQRQMILAKCNECCGEYVDGNLDCRIPACPLYPLMPYSENRRKLSGGGRNRGPQQNKNTDAALATSELQMIQQEELP